MIFEYILFYWADLAQKEVGPKSTQKNEIGPGPAQKRTYLWLDSTQSHGLG
jgi:hypothetical protein